MNQDDRRRMTEDGPRSPVSGPPKYKFQSLQVYQLALDYLDEVYDLAYHLPDVEKFNLRSQLERAGTSIVLNIAEGSTDQSDPEQSRFVSPGQRSARGPRSSVMMSNFHYLARGSLTETQSHLEYGRRVGYIPASVANDLSVKLESLHTDLNKVISALRRQAK